MNALCEALWASSAPEGAEAARERTVAAAIAQMPREASPPPVRRLAGHRRLAVAAAAIIAGLFLALTPPGRDAVTWAAELVGIGEPSSVQEPDLRDPRLSEIQTRVGDALVANSGQLLSGERFEIVAWAAVERELRNAPVPIDPRTGKPVDVPREHGAGEVVSCLGVVYPEVGKQETGKWCLDNALDSPIHVFGMGPDRNLPSYGPDAPYVVIGVTEPDVASVEVTYEGAEGKGVSDQAVLGRLDGELLERVGGGRPFGFFVASIPYDGAEKVGFGELPDSHSLKTLVVTAYDARGQELGRDLAGAGYEHAIEQSIDSQALRERLDHCRELMSREAPKSEIKEACATPRP